MQPLILDLWHRSFLTTIMVDHYPLSEFLHAVKLNCLSCTNSSFMLCSFGISTEASAPAVLSFSIALYVLCITVLSNSM